MGNDELHRQREQQQHQQQQPLYMSPQTENLTHMYSLVDNLVKQLRKNRKEKEKVLWSVDVLSKQLRERAASQPSKNDLVLFNRFLSQRTASPDLCSDISDVISASERVDVLQRQNEQLRKTLKAKRDLNKQTMDLLRVHEDSLEQVVTLLRSDVVEFHKKFVEKVRRKLDDEVIPLEDEEFKSYVDNVDEIQELMLVSELYRNVLRLGDISCHDGQTA